MKELYDKLWMVSDINNSLALLRKQKENFIKKWDGKEHVPFMIADAKAYEGEPTIMIFLPKIKAIEAIEEKIRFNESELEKHKSAAIEAMQRLIEEWK